MKFGYGLVAMVATLVFLVSQGHYGAQVAVLALTLGIFFGTVSLRKPSAGDATTTHPGHG